jgi:hypothetical protein
MAELNLREVEPKPTRNLHVELEPYPHLRDDDGPILANDYTDTGKLAFILKQASQGAKVD